MLKLYDAKCTFDDCARQGKRVEVFGEGIDENGLVISAICDKCNRAAMQMVYSALNIGGKTGGEKENPAPKRYDIKVCRKGKYFVGALSMDVPPRKGDRVHFRDAETGKTVQRGTVVSTDMHETPHGQYGLGFVKGEKSPEPSKKPDKKDLN